MTYQTLQYIATINLMVCFSEALKFSHPLSFMSAANIPLTSLWPEVSRNVETGIFGHMLSYNRCITQNCEICKSGINQYVLPESITDMLFTQFVKLLGQRSWKHLRNYDNFLNLYHNFKPEVNIECQTVIIFSFSLYRIHWKLD